MKRTLIPLAIIIVAASIGCKKDHPYLQPPPVTETKKAVVTTLAGVVDPGGGYLDGPALAAKFGFPEDVTVMPDGSVYVADLFNNRIRKIVDGKVTTFAGKTNYGGIADGNGLSALFIYPIRMTTDANGNLYTLDGDDPRVRKITPGADVTTFAGAATPGFKDGAADAALFQPGNGGIVADVHGNVYKADAVNNSIRKISPSGEVTTIAGNGNKGFNNGNGTAAQFNGPTGIAIDGNGNLFVADAGNYRIRKITPDGQVSTFAGSGVQGDADGDAGAAQLDVPLDMVIDAKGNLYITDIHRIRKISPQGVVSTVAGGVGGFADGDGASARFYLPTGLGIDAQGNLYIADTFNHVIRKISFQ